MARLIRTFHPVGQGAFYTERFIIDESNRSKDINVVYDCGSFNREALRRAIDAEFKKGDTIHAVFISHFHYDHISGLDYLRKRCKIKNLYFPYISEELRLRNMIECLIDNNGDGGFEFKFVDSTEEINRGEYQINLHEVSVADERNYVRDGEVVEAEEGRSISSGKNVSRGIGLHDIDWVYIPFNFRWQENLRALYDELQVNSIGDIKSMLCNDDGYKRVTNAYKKVFPSRLRNETSMTVYSGFLRKIREAIVKERCCICRWPMWCPLWDYNCFIKVGCLYTGDYPAHDAQYMKTLAGAYGKIFNGQYINYLQVPHHGSINGFNVALLSCGARRLIISAGNENQFGHPSMEVIETLISARCPFSIVSECLNSMSISEFII